MKKTYSALLMLVVSLMVQSGTAQQKNGQDIGINVKIDSLLDTYSIEEIVKFRNYYQQQVEQVEKKKIALREQTILNIEKFVKDNPESKALDRFLMRLAELYYEKANETFLSRTQRYDQSMAERDSSQVDSVLQEPKRDFSQPLSIYERLITEMPYSHLVDDAYYNKAYLLEEIGKADSAFQIYYYISSEMAESRYAPESLMRIAEYYFNPPHIQLDSAITYYKKILEYKDSPGFNEALNRLGLIHYNLGKYTDAILYFTYLVDDFKRTQKSDAENYLTDPALIDQALDYIGKSFIEQGGHTAVVEYISKLGTPDYGFFILQKLGNVYIEEKGEYENAIKAYSAMLEIYPGHLSAPEIHHKIIDCFKLLKQTRMAYLHGDKIYDLYKPGSAWWKNHEAEIKQETVFPILDAVLRENIYFMLQQAALYNDEICYLLVVDDCNKYLKLFPTNTNAAQIRWNMAFILDKKFKQYDKAYEEYMRICDLHWNSSYQKVAAENSITIAKKMVEQDSSNNVLFAPQKIIRDSLGKEENLLSSNRFNRIKLNNNEKKLHRAYNNYIKIYPHEPGTIKILTDAGELFFNNNLFPEALRYFNTAIKHFPGHEDINMIKYQTVLCYLRKGDYKSAEIVAGKLKNSDGIEPELTEKAKRRLAESIFLSAKMYANSAKHLQAANEYLRVASDVPGASIADLSLFNAAQEYEKINEFSRTIETYNFLIETFSESKFLLDAMNNLAIDYGKLEEYKNAALTFERLFAQTQDKTQAHDALYNSSRFFVKGEYWKEAIRINRSFVEKYPDSEKTADMLFNIAKYYLHLNDSEKSNQIYGEYVESFPDSPEVVEACFRRGRYFENINDLENASMEYNKAVDKNELFNQKDLETSDYFAAEALFQLTKMKFNEFREIDFVLPVEIMEEAQLKKHSLLIEIIDGFTKVASYGTFRLYEATYNIGKIYEEFASSWARQEIPLADETQRIIKQKEVNASAVDVYEKAGETFKQSIQTLEGKACDYEQVLINADTTGKSIEELKNIVARESTLRIARTWISRCKENLSRIFYDKAELNLKTVNMFLKTPLPQELSNLAQLEHSKQTLNHIVAPLLIDIIDDHIRNIKEARKAGLKNQWVKLSRKKVIETNIILAEQYKSLAYKTLDLYNQKVEAYRQLVDSKPGSIEKNYGVFLPDQLAALINYYHEFVLRITEIYSLTLNIANRESIQDSSLSHVKEDMFKDLFELIQKNKQSAQTAYANRKIYNKLFIETNQKAYEYAYYSFKYNYESINKHNRQLLEQGYQISRENQIDNQWTKKILLALIEENPGEFSSLLELKTENKTIVSDQSWHASKKYCPGWTNFDFNDSSWKTAEYIDTNEQLPENEQPPVWLKINDTTGFTYDTTYVAENDSNNFFINIDSLLLGIVSDDSVKQDSTTNAGAKKKMLITPHPQVVRTSSARVWFRKYFEITGLPVSAEIRLRVNDSYSLFLNEEFVAAYTSDGTYDTTEHVYNLTDLLIENNNLIAIEVKDSDKSGGGLIARLKVASMPGWEEKKQQLLFETRAEKL